MPARRRRIKKLARTARKAGFGASAKGPVKRTASVRKDTPQSQRPGPRTESDPSGGRDELRKARAEKRSSATSAPGGKRTGGIRKAVNKLKGRGGRGALGAAGGRGGLDAIKDKFRKRQELKKRGGRQELNDRKGRRQGRRSVPQTRKVRGSASPGRSVASSLRGQIGNRKGRVGTDDGRGFFGGRGRGSVSKISKNGEIQRQPVAAQLSAGRPALTPEQIEEMKKRKAQGLPAPQGQPTPFDKNSQPQIPQDQDQPQIAQGGAVLQGPNSIPGGLPDPTGGLQAGGQLQPSAPAPQPGEIAGGQAGQPGGAPAPGVPQIDPATGMVTMPIQDALDSQPGQLGPGGLQAGGQLQPQLPPVLPQAPIAPQQLQPAQAIQQPGLPGQPQPGGLQPQPLQPSQGMQIQPQAIKNFGTQQPVPDVGGAQAVQAQRLLQLQQFGG